MMMVTKTPTATYTIKEWAWGMEEDALKREMRKSNAVNHRPEQTNSHSQHTG